MARDEEDDETGESEGEESRAEREARETERRVREAAKRVAAESGARAKRRRRGSGKAPEEEETSPEELARIADAKAAANAKATADARRTARRALGAGATLAVIGIALVGVGPSDAGTAIVLGGLIALIYGIHTYGRLGPETPSTPPAAAKS